MTLKQLIERAEGTGLRYDRNTRIDKINEALSSSGYYKEHPDVESRAKKWFENRPAVTSVGKSVGKIEEKNTEYLLKKQASDKHSVETYKEWKKKLEAGGAKVSDEEVKEMLDSVRSYTAEEYLDIVTASGEFKYGTYRFVMTEAEKEVAVKQAEAIENFLKIAPKHEGTIYRGLGFAVDGTPESVADWTRFIETTKKGNIITMDSLSSWTKKRSIAEQFAYGKADFDEEAEHFANVIMVLDKTKSGVYVKDLSYEDVQYQEEVIMPKKIQYKVDKIDKFERDGDITMTVYVSEV